MPGSSGRAGPVRNGGVHRDVIRHRPSQPARVMDQRCIRQGVAAPRLGSSEKRWREQGRWGRGSFTPETAGELDFAAPAFPVGFPHTQAVGLSGCLDWVPGICCAVVLNLSLWDKSLRLFTLDVQKMFCRSKHVRNKSLECQDCLLSVRSFLL